MTTPKTLTIFTPEWNALLAHNAGQLAAFFQQQPTPSPESYQNIIVHMERMREMLPGWLASVPAVPTGAANQQEQAKVPVPPQPNGAAPKQRGWPKGKKRARTAEAVQ